MTGYAIIDFSRGDFLVVDPDRKEVVRVSLGGETTVLGGNDVSVSLKDKGGGQKIAGYQTHKYRIIANGEPCGTVYASKKLPRNDSISAMFHAMGALQNQVGGITAGLSGMLSVCQRANLQLGDAMASSGAPMRVIDAGGKVFSEVVSVDTDSKGADYQIPAGMTVVSMDEKMSQATEQLQNMPEMNELMQQMQKSGEEMSPEMQQKMEQLQKMLQQMQQ